MQRVQLVGTNDAGDYVYLETYVPSGGENYHEWIVETLKDESFRLWRRNNYAETGIVTHRPAEKVGHAELVRAGYADAPRVSKENI